MTFAAWMAAVDRFIWQVAGVSVHDLPDRCYRDWYDDKLNPQEAGEIVLEDEGLLTDIE